MQSNAENFRNFSFVSDIAIFVLKRDVKLQLTNTGVSGYFALLSMLVGMVEGMVEVGTA